MSRKKKRILNLLLFSFAGSRRNVSWIFKTGGKHYDPVPPPVFCVRSYFPSCGNLLFRSLVLQLLPHP